VYQYAIDQLSSIDGIRFIGEAEQKISVISFLIDGIHPYDLGTLIDKKGIAVRTGNHCAEPLMKRFDVTGTIRASIGLYNTKGDIDEFMAGMKKAVKILKAS